MTYKIRLIDMNSRPKRVLYDSSTSDPDNDPTEDAESSPNKFRGMKMEMSKFEHDLLRNRTEVVSANEFGDVIKTVLWIPNINISQLNGDFFDTVEMRDDDPFKAAYEGRRCGRTYYMWLDRAINNLDVVGSLVAEYRWKAYVSLDRMKDFLRTGKLPRRTPRTDAHYESIIDRMLNENYRMHLSEMMDAAIDSSCRIREDRAHAIVLLKKPKKYPMKNLSLTKICNVFNNSETPAPTQPRDILFTVTWVHEEEVELAPEDPKWFAEWYYEKQEIEVAI